MSKLLSQFIPPSPSPAESTRPFSMSVSPWNHMLLDTFGLLRSSFISHPKEKHLPHTLRQARWSLGLCLNTSSCGATGVFLSVHRHVWLLSRPSVWSEAIYFPAVSASRATRTNPEPSVSQDSYPRGLPPSPISNPTFQWIPLLIWLLNLPRLSFQRGLGPDRLPLV